MNIPTHVLTSYWAAQRLRARHPWAVALGAFIPDTYYTAKAVKVMVRERRLPGPDDLDYFRPRTKPADVLGHSLLPAGATLLGGWAARSPRVTALAWGWLGHIVVDLGMHHTDAAPPFAPLSGWVFHAPVSGSEQDRYANWVVTAEAVLCILCGWDLARSRGSCTAGQ